MQIRKQYPKEAERLGAGSAFVQRVDCVGESETRYSCVARVKALNAFCRKATQTVAITGTCDAAGCIWRTDPF